MEKIPIDQSTTQKPIQVSRLLSIKLIIEELIFYKTPILEFSPEQISVIKRALFSHKSKLRKAVTILILYLSDENRTILEQFRRNKLLLNFDGYVGISLDFKGDLVKPKEFLRFLKKDSHFMKNEVKCNSMLIKFMKSNHVGSQKKRKVKFLTMTELKYYLQEKDYNSIPDPQEYAVWFYKQQEKFVYTNLEFCDEFEKLKEKKLKREKRRHIWGRKKALIFGSEKRVEGKKKTIVKKSGGFKIEKTIKMSRKVQRSKSYDVKKKPKKINIKVRNRKRLQLRAKSHTPNPFFRRGNTLKPRKYQNENFVTRGHVESVPIKKRKQFLFPRKKSAKKFKIGMKFKRNCSKDYDKEGYSALTSSPIGKRINIVEGEFFKNKKKFFMKKNFRNGIRKKRITFSISHGSKDASSDENMIHEQKDKKSFFFKISKKKGRSYYGNDQY